MCNIGKMIDEYSLKTGFPPELVEVSSIVVASSEKVRCLVAAISEVWLLHRSGKTIKSHGYCLTPKCQIRSVEKLTRGPVGLQKS